jgi:biopolymer transport protein ExbD
MARRNDEPAELPISSMIDVVFLLLIYFIATQKDVIPETHLAVNLPSPAGESEDEDTPKVLEVAILPNGRILFGMGEGASGVVTLEGLRRRMETLSKSPKNREAMVFVKVHVRAPTAILVNVLDCFQGLGLTKFNLTALED